MYNSSLRQNESAWPCQILFKAFQKNVVQLLGSESLDRDVISANR